MKDDVRFIKNEEKIIETFKQMVVEMNFENITVKELQVPIFKEGKLVYDDPDIITKRNYCNEQMKKLYPEVRRSINPHIYYVDGTEEYVDFKYNLIEKTRKLVR